MDYKFNGFYKAAKEYNLSDGEIVDLYKYSADNDIRPEPVISKPPTPNAAMPTPLKPEIPVVNSPINFPKLPFNKI
jgi:hypothetical protein